MDPDTHKMRAGQAALDHIRSGMIVGLGTGSTARFFILALADAVRNGTLRDIRGIPTSIGSQKIAADAGLTLITFADVPAIDVTVDGADEIAPDLSLIKGLGGALLREKLVAQNSKRLIIIADGEKIVPRLGTRSPLPVEVTQFGAEASERFLASFGCIPKRRANPDGSPFITDNNNYIFDCRFPGIEDPARLDRQLSARAGIVESGLFLGIADLAIIAQRDSIGEDSIKTLIAPQRVY